MKQRNHKHSRQDARAQAQAYISAAYSIVGNREEVTPTEHQRKRLTQAAGRYIRTNGGQV